ncbi:class I SAM-dependent methyltransferase [Citrobacter amalonaticus]|uniref:Class I SAM-dependent methyltransferase n=1 Tax=Citrobacter amalonaticus TaxID=35703 RepID=A0A2S4S0R1_CITAM|nr:class I SAM-dependent methyltransferase [Citrobacter amalonaticus]POT75967.1 class I SAM-dependent methyltransferase [Citrobacter amalonaticus]POU67035.1 class I SAM-dependent methyltransferase [Citrobacter amalonaticus]POV05202.1 class I SAM-dependent methyltransferase [Citrobacter amalonaticus]
MDIRDLIMVSPSAGMSDLESKIPWDDEAFSQRMLENHLSQDHDWASRKLAIIEDQVAWIAQQLPTGAQLLDLGCGPGFYTQRLTQRGFHCTGVDFSPASIRWAREQAQQNGLEIDYRCEDVRQFTPDQTFDFIIMTFGELNVFSADDAQTLLSRCAQWLKPEGKLLIEVHTFEEVKRQGMAEGSWQRCPQGLFLADPHLLLIENRWDEKTQISATTFWAVKTDGNVTRFGSQMHAWRDEEYQQLLMQCGFLPPTRVAGDDWPVSETFAGKLFALQATVR